MIYQLCHPAHLIGLVDWLAESVQFFLAKHLTRVATPRRVYLSARGHYPRTDKNRPLPKENIVDTLANFIAARTAGTVTVEGLSVTYVTAVTTEDGRVISPSHFFTQKDGASVTNRYLGTANDGDLLDYFADEVR